MPSAWGLLSAAVGHLHRHTYGHRVTVATCGLLSFMVGVFAGLFVGWVAAYWQRRHRPALEFEADAWAASHGYPLTATHRDTMTQHYPAPRALTAARGHAAPAGPVSLSGGGPARRHGVSASGHESAAARPRSGRAVKGSGG